MAVKSSNQITITDITDAYSVFMDSEAFTFNADTSWGISGSCATNITAMCGTEPVEVAVSQVNIEYYEQGSSEPMGTPPFNTTVSISEDHETATITITAVSNATLEHPVEVAIPVNVDYTITVTKRFTISAAKTGAQGSAGAAGKGISSVVTYFQTNNSSTKPSAGTSSPWSTTATAPSASNHYMWAFDYYTYTDSSHSNSGVRLAAEYTDASKWSQGTALTGTSGNITGYAGLVGDQYLNSSTGNTYKCVTAGTSSTAVWNYVGNIKGTNGTNGQDGADAFAISITTDNGTVFKNNTGTTTLTAHVYKGGVELNVANNGNVTDTGASGESSYGTIKWYIGSSATGTAAKTRTVSASDVQSAAVYTCKLEA